MLQGVAVVKVLHFGIGLELVHFLFDVPSWKDSFGGSAEPILDRLDTFPDAIHPGNTLVTLFLRIGGHKPNISGTGKI